MILRNKSGKERNFKKLLEIENKNKKYIIYEDINTLNIYGGKVNKNVLETLNDEEYEMLNNILNKLVGSEL